MKVKIHWSNGDKHTFVLNDETEKSAINALEHCLAYKETKITTVSLDKTTYHFNANHIRMLEIESE